MEKDLSRTKMSVAWSITHLREARDLTQAQLAEKSGIPRSSLTYIESGNGNPSLESLAKIAAALQVTLGELLSPPLYEYRHYTKNQLRLQKRNQGQIKHLIPDPVSGIEVDEIEIEANGQIVGAPHLPGAREYFYCLKGFFEIRMQSKSAWVEPGEVLSFAGDQNHRYVNWTEAKAVGLSVVILPQAHTI